MSANMIFKKFVFRLLRFTERLIAWLMGKGYGSATLEQEVKAALSLLTRIPVLAIDVGGNVGGYSKALLSRVPNLEIHIFEPSSVNTVKLHNSFTGNQKVYIKPMGLSDKDADAILYADKLGGGLGSLTNRRLEHFGIEMNATEMVHTIRFEDYWKNTLKSRTIDLAKLDIEGFELAALHGFGQAIRETRVIQFEFGGCNLDTRTNFQDFYYFFTGLNFKIYRITPLGLNEINKYDELDEIYLTTNFLAVNINLT
jgi:FkbM family methyltransferase